MEHAHQMLTDTPVIVCLALREFVVNLRLTIAVQIHAITMVCAIACPADIRAHVWLDLLARSVKPL